jgi:hypothetical protein
MLVLVAPLVVYTDTNPLMFLRSLQNPNQRLMRWALFLQLYNLEIRPIKGKENVLADDLSPGWQRWVRGYRWMFVWFGNN